MADIFTRLKHLTSEEIFETISRRHSCRSFSDDALDSSICGDLAEATQQSGRLIFLNGNNGHVGTYGVISGEKASVALLAGKNADDLIDAAMDAEEIVLWLTHIGIGSCWLGGTFRVSGTGADNSIPAVIVIGVPKEKPRLTDRLMRRFAKSDSRKPFDDLFIISGVCPDSLRMPLEAVRLAPSACNAQPWRAFADSAGCVHFFCVTDNKYTYMDMGIALCHFKLTAPEGEFYVDREAAGDIFPGAVYIRSWRPLIRHN